MFTDKLEEHAYKDEKEDNKSYVEESINSLITALVSLCNSYW